jgi:rhodanese-related sulfurtransferase/rubrerythrin
MKLPVTPGKVINIWQDQLRTYMATNHEDDYVLVDVREPEEYQAGHIPGAKLMPLPDFDVRVAELARLEDKNLIFYCRSGSRSARVCDYASRTIGFPYVYNLAGGFAGWVGQKLVELPRLKAIHITGDVKSILTQALELEKGADKLYAALVEHFKDTEVAPVINELARAEVAHARVLYDMLSKLVGKPEQTFEALFAGLVGELIESGESYEEVAARAKAQGLAGSLGLLEMALEIELRAYDLYKNLADQAPTESSREVLAELAQHEKRHAEAVLRKLERMASRAQLSNAPAPSP